MYDFEPGGRLEKAPSWLKHLLLAWNRVRVRVSAHVPPVALVEEDVLLRHRSQRRWGSCVSAVLVGMALGGSGFVTAAAIMVGRTWQVSCNVPLGAYVIVALLLCLPLVALVFVVNWHFRRVHKLLLAVVCATLFLWAVVGVGLVAAADTSCRTDLNAVWGLSVAFVVLFMGPMLAATLYCTWQLLMGDALQRGVVVGDVLPRLLTGTKQPRNAMLGVTVLGDTGTGKTSLLRGLHRLVPRVFPPASQSRLIDENPARFTIKANRITFNEEDPRANPLRTTDLVNADCVVLCFSLADRRSFQAVQSQWLPHAVAHSQVPLVLVGTHADVARANEPPRQPSQAQGPVAAELLVPVQGCPVASLPTSVVLRVFSFLPNVDLAHAQRTCLQWRDLGRHPWLWRERTTGVVAPRKVRAWMSTVARERLMGSSAFSRIGAFFCVDCNEQGAPDDRALVRLWKRVAALALLNETKLYVARAADGEMLYSRRPLQVATAEV